MTEIFNLNNENKEKNKKRILVVDDDYDILTQSIDILHMLDYQVVTAVNGREALEKLKAGEKCDAIITDYNMPEMDGVELLKEVRKEESIAAMPFILRSAAGNNKLKEEVKKFGALYLDKPHGLGDLEDKLKEALSETK